MITRFARPLFVLLLPALAVLAPAETSIQPAVYSAATNFSVDLLGEPDTRPGTWGRADYAVWTITFNPPPGKRVRILRVYGDFLAWPVGLVEPGRFAGVLFGLQTTAPEGSVRGDWMADNCFLYVQHATGGAPVRVPFNYDTRAGGLLEPDHKLLVKVAVWLNDTERKIHMEPTFTMVFRFEEDEQLWHVGDQSTLTWTSRKPTAR